jgi:hypothetical protein
MFCTSCGGQNSDDARFCHRCGRALTAVEPSRGVVLGPTGTPNDIGVSSSEVGSPVNVVAGQGAPAAMSGIPAGAHITIINQQGGAGSGASPALLTDASDKSPGMAAFLSLLIVGAGQCYNGEIGKGIGMFLFCVLLWTAMLGWIINIWSIVDAHSVAKRKRLAWQMLMAASSGQGQVARTQ